MNVDVSPIRSGLKWQDRPLQELLRLAWPTVLSLLSVSMMTLVDSMFLGHLGAAPLAAAGLGGVVVFAVLSFGLAIFGAAKVDVGVQYGAGNSEALRRNLAGFLRLALLLGVASMLVGLLASWALPYLTPEPTVATLAGQYAEVRCGGFLFALLAAAIGAFRQAQGDAKAAMHAALLANVVNIPLNYLLLFGLHWGVRGSAFATVIATVVEAGFLLFRQLRPHPAAGVPPGLHWSAGGLVDARRAFRIGLPTGVERVLDMVAFALVPLLLARLGAQDVAAHQIILQIMMFSFLPQIALSESVSVLISQSLGARRSGMVSTIAKLGLVGALTYGSVCAVSCWSIPGLFAGLFTRDEELVQLSIRALGIAAVLQLINAVYNSCKGVLRGLGQFQFVAWVTVGCAWVITPPLTYLLGVRLGWGVQGAWLVLCLEVSMGVVLMGLRVRRMLAQLPQAS